MGSYNSGRYGGQPTSEATASLVLNMRSLTLGGIRPGLLGKASIGYGADCDGDLSVEHDHRHVRARARVHRACTR